MSTYDSGNVSPLLEFTMTSSMYPSVCLINVKISKTFFVFLSTTPSVVSPASISSGFFGSSVPIVPMFASSKPFFVIRNCLVTF